MKNYEDRTRVTNTESILERVTLRQNGLAFEYC